ncbi:MAG: sulfite exporter TauE/SafE family protein [Polynucleobacter sp.]|nr:sulfite exporter TauE/SafE family protein [Polynucleobacter sp.]
MNSFDWFAIALLAVSAILGGLFRRLSGFGGAMVMSPLLMGFLPLAVLIPVVMFIELLGGVWLARNWGVAKEDRPRMYRLLLGAAICLPIGIAVSMQFPVQFLKIAASFAVLCFALYFLFQPHMQVALSNLKDTLIGSGAGLLLGSCGFGGPVVALYLNASSLEFSRSRALLSQVTSGMALFAIITASIISSDLTWLPLLLVGLPAFLLGFYIAHRIDQEHLITQAKIKKICLYLLAANAIFNLLVSALI